MSMSSHKDIRGDPQSTSQHDQTGKDSGNDECESNVRAFSPDIKEEPIEPDYNYWERMQGASAMTSDFHQSPKQDSLYDDKEEIDAVIESLPIHFDSSPSCSTTQYDPLSKVVKKRRGRMKGSSYMVKDMIIKKNRAEMWTSNVKILPKPILPSNPPNCSNISFLPPRPTQQPVQLLAPPTMQLNMLNNTNVLPFINQLPFVNTVNTSTVPPPVSQSVPPVQDTFNPKIEQVFYTGWKKDLHGIAPKIGIPMPVLPSNVLIQDKEAPAVTKVAKKPLLKSHEKSGNQSQSKSLNRSPKIGRLLNEPHKVEARTMSSQPYTAPLLVGQLGSNQPINQWPIGPVAPSNNLTFFQPFPILNATAPGLQLQPSVPMLYQPPVINVAAPNPLLISGTPVLPAPISLSVNEQSKSCHSSLKSAKTVTPANPNQVSGAMINCVTPASIGNQFIFFPNVSQQQSAPQQTPAVTTMCSISTASLTKNSITKTQSVSSSVPNQTFSNSLRLNNLSSASTSNVVINAIPSSSVAPSNLLTSFPTPVGSLYHPNIPILQTVLPQQGSLLFQNGLVNLQGSQLLPSMPVISMNALTLPPNLASSVNKNSSHDDSTRMAKAKAEVSSILNSLVSIQPKTKKKEGSPIEPKNVDSKGGGETSIAKPTDTFSKFYAIRTTPTVDMNTHTTTDITNITSSTSSAGNMSPLVLAPLSKNQIANINASSKLNNLDAESEISDEFSGYDSSSSISEDSNEEIEGLNLKPFMNWFVDVRPNPKPSTLMKTHVKENVSSEEGREAKKRKIQSPCVKPKKEDSGQEMSLLSFHGDVELLKQALVKCTVPLKRLYLSDDQLKDTLSYDSSKSHSRSKCETKNSELSYEMKKGKSSDNSHGSIKKKKTTLTDSANSKIKTKTSSDSHSRPSKEDTGNLKNPIFREWVPLEVVGDLTIKGRMIEYSVDDVSRGRARRSTRVENKPWTDDAGIQQGLYCEDTESESFSSGSQEDEECTSKFVKTDVGEKELVKEENVESDDVDEWNQEVVRLEKDNVSKVTKTDKIQDKSERKSVKLLDVGVSQAEDEHAIEEIVYKSSNNISEEERYHYSSESDSDLFEEEAEVTMYRAMDNIHKMHHLMKRHKEVTVYLLKYTDKFSTFQELNKTVHVCKVCKLFKTNGLFRLFKHLRREHRVD